MNGDATICPHCLRFSGNVATPCRNVECSKKGYHYIPSRYLYSENQEGKFINIDPEIGKLIDKYLLVKRLASGGMGAIYLALQMPLQRKVALKMLAGINFKDDDRKRFEREAKTISLLYHPNIVSLFEFGYIPDSGAPFMALEYVEGDDLATLIMRKKEKGEEWSREAIIRIFTQVLNGLGVAHNQGLVHRDMKPQNIMITNVEGNPWFVKILDFGLVRALVDIPGVEVITSHGELWGTPEYMAPEQLTDTGKIDHRCDLYAVGVILLEMLTGQAVFRRKSINEIFSLKLDDKFDPLSTVEPHKLSPLLELFFRKVLDPNPEKRFRNAGEMREALVSAIEEKVTEKLSVQSEKNANVVEKDKDENKGVQIKEMEKEFERERDLTKLGQYILIGLGVIALIIIIFWLTGIL